MTTRPFIQSRAPRLVDAKHSSIVPFGFSIVVDRDGVTPLVDGSGKLLITPNGR